MDGDSRLDLAKFLLADSPHEHYVLDAAEGAVLGTVSNDSFSNGSAYSRKRCQLIR